jgi:hypothetical protein
MHEYKPEKHELTPISHESEADGASPYVPMELPIIQRPIIGRQALNAAMHEVAGSEPSRDSDPSEEQQPVPAESTGSPEPPPTHRDETPPPIEPPSTAEGAADGDEQLPKYDMYAFVDDHVQNPEAALHLAEQLGETVARTTDTYGDFIDPIAHGSIIKLEAPGDGGTFKIAVKQTTHGLATGLRFEPLSVTHTATKHEYMTTRLIPTRTDTYADDRSGQQYEVHSDVGPREMQWLTDILQQAAPEAVSIEDIVASLGNVIAGNELERFRGRDLPFDAHTAEESSEIITNSILRFITKEGTAWTEDGPVRSVTAHDTIGGDLTVEAGYQHGKPYARMQLPSHQYSLYVTVAEDPQTGFEQGVIDDGTAPVPIPPSLARQIRNHLHNPKAL